MCVCIEYSRSKHKVTKIFMHCKLFFISATHERLSETTSEVRKLWEKENSAGNGMLLDYIFIGNEDFFRS